MNGSKIKNMYGYGQSQIQVIYMTTNMEKSNLNENNQWSNNRIKKVKHEDCEITQKHN